jgi:hypothetical protein
MASELLAPVFTPISDAMISDDGLYRYQLRRVWDPTLPILVYICLNPSVADSAKDDPSIRVMRSRARRLGYGGIVVVNLFAWRSTDPGVIAEAVYLCDGTRAPALFDPIGPENGRYIDEAVKEASLVVCAWGNHGALWDRCYEVERRLRKAGVPLHCIDLTKGGQPCHPLRKALDLPLVPLPPMESRSFR